MSDQLHPGVFWRIVDESGIGPDSVTLVFQTEEETAQSLQLETDIVTAEFLSLTGHAHVDVAWSREDFELFRILLSKQFPDRYTESVEFQLDLSDDDVLDTIAVLAAARFNIEQDANDWVITNDWNTVQRAYELGDMVSLATDDGFCLGVLVGLDSVEARVVLLECLDPEQGAVDVRLHELVRVYKADLLPETFGNVMVTDHDTVH